MAFPVTPLEPTVEIQLDGVWTDVSDDVYCRTGEGITITRGQRDEGTQTEPSQCSLTFNNRDGRFSPRNPMSPYYGMLGRNTPLRVSALLGTKRLVSDSANYMRTADSAGLSITGDIDLRADVRLADWGQGGRFVSKIFGAGQFSYVLDSTSAGKLVLFWSADGSSSLSATSTVPMQQLSGRQTVRATLDVDNGAGGNTVTFYTGSSVDGPWTQIGDPVVQSGTTSIFNSTSEVRGPTLNGAQVYALKVLQGIGGTERANPDFTAQAEGATSFADAAGNTWTMTGSPSITSRRYRFHGEVSNWPPKWDVSGKDVWVPVTASGILRRLGQGAASLQSALRRGIPSEAGVVAYWPMEDLDGATQVASALTGGAPMSVVGTTTFAADSEFAGSLPLPQIGSAVLTGSIPAATAGTIQERFVVLVPAAGIANNTVLVRLFTTGAISFWDIVYTTADGGTLGVMGYTVSSAGAVATVPLNTGNTGVNGVRFQVGLQLATSGANIAWSLATLNIDTDSALVPAGVVAGSVGAATLVQVNPSAVDMGETAVGHVHVRSAVAANPYGLENYVRGWVPETPGRRIERLSSEEDIPFVAHGYLGPASGTPSGVGTFQGMGPQSPLGLLDLIGEAVATDLGVLIEPRASFAIGYRPRETLYSQPATVELDYDNLAELEPVEDDQASRNDITVTRTGGSSARQVLETGPLSIQAPPDGIGVYDDAVPINIATDAALEQQASWRLHVGTVDEARYPAITLGLERPAFAADQELTSAALDLDQGDLLTIANPPAWLPPDTIRQIALGFTETIEPFAWTIEVNCAPASPYDIGVYDQGDPVSRYDTAGSSVDEDLTTTETDVTVATTTGPVWINSTDHPTHFPFAIVIGGEEMTVTAVSGSSSPQTFTVTRSVNGVVKTHAAGAAISLADPVYYAL